MWQPIKTAPINQTLLVAINGKHVTIGDKLPGDMGWCWEPVDSGDDEDDERVTHWMPLPAPPQEQQ